MNENREKEAFVGVRRTKNGKKRLSQGYDERKTGKGGFRRGTTNEKWQKKAFPREGKSKIGENRLSPTRENQKTLKIGFPPRGKTRNRRKSNFRHGGKQKIGKINFPSRGKIKNQRKTAFPHGGKSKNAVGSISYSSEKRKAPKVWRNNFRGPVHILHTLFRYLSTWQLLFSLLLLFGDDLVFRGRHAIAGSKATVESGTGIEA